MITLLQTQNEQVALFEELCRAARRRIPAARAACLDLRGIDRLPEFKYTLQLESRKVEPTVFVYAVVTDALGFVPVSEQGRFTFICWLARQLQAVLVILMPHNLPSQGEPLPFLHQPEAGGSSFVESQQEHFLLGGALPGEYTALGGALVGLLDSGVYGRYNWKNGAFERISTRFVEHRISVLDRQF